MTSTPAIPLEMVITIVGGIVGYVIARFQQRSAVKAAIYKRIEQVKRDLEGKIDKAADEARAESGRLGDRITQLRESGSQQWDLIRDKEMAAQQTYATKEDVRALSTKFDTFAQQQHEFHTQLLAVLRGIGNRKGGNGGGSLPHAK